MDKNIISRPKTNALVANVANRPCALRPPRILSLAADFFGKTRMIYGGQVIHHPGKKERSKLCKVCPETAAECYHDYRYLEDRDLFFRNSI